MNDEISMILKKLITENGTNLCRDSIKLQELLSNLCGENPKEINLIIAALQQKIVQEILNLPENSISEEKYLRLAAKLFNEVGLTKENSMWAVKTWAEALGKTVTCSSSDIGNTNHIAAQNNLIPVNKTSLEAAHKNNNIILKILLGIFCFILIIGIGVAIAFSTYKSEARNDTRKTAVTKTETQNTKETPADDLDNKSFSLTGTINSNLKVHMKLNFKQTEVIGTYYYDNYNKNISLKGTYDKEHNLKITEYGDSDNITGTFNGQISISGDFKGTWSTPDGSKHMPFSLLAKDTNNDSTSSNSASDSTKNKESSSPSSTGSYTAIKNFDYSNRYTEKEYKGDDTKSNTGDSVTDSINDTGWAIYNSTQKLITDVNNNIQKTYTVNWGFVPQKLTYDGKSIKIDGQFYNNNEYATISNIRNLVFSVVDSNNKIVGMYDFSKDTSISSLVLPYNQAVSYSFTISNIPKGANLLNYATIISSDFDAIADEEKIKRDHPDVYNAAEYYKQQAAQYKEKMQIESEEYIDMVNRFEADKASDASNY